MADDAGARRHRVLVVDDSAVVRRLVVEALAGEPAIEVAGTANNGRAALILLETLAIDLVVLDVEMPELDGVGALREIRLRSPLLPVVMFSAQTAHGTQTTLAALLAGASDYVHKPSGRSGAEDARREIRALLAPKIRALCERAARRDGAPRTPASVPVPAPAPAPEPDGNVPAKAAGAPVSPRRVHRDPALVVAIGVSTGGPAALAQLLGALGPVLHAPLLIVQHMPPTFTAHLAESLARKCGLDVREARAGEVLAPGQCRIAPGDFHLQVEPCAGGARTVLHQGPPENSCRPSVDVLFRSLAPVFRSRALGVVLTGMGQDGLAGAREMHAQGASLLAQDEATSVVWGMPGFVVRAGLAERVLDLDGLAAEIQKRTRPRSDLQHARAG